MGDCRTRLAQVMRQKPTKADLLTVERLGSVVCELTSQSRKTMRIILRQIPRQRESGVVEAEVRYKADAGEEKARTKTKPAGKKSVAAPAQ